MKIDRVTVRIAELRKTEEFENKRYEIEVSATVGPKELVEDVTLELTTYANDQVIAFFDDDSDVSDELDRLQAKVRRLKR